VVKIIHEFLEFFCQKYPHKAALLHTEHSVTYTQVNTLSSKISHLLLACGLKKTDLVLVIMENSDVVKAYIAEKLPGHKHHKHGYILESLPKKPSGKIYKETSENELLHEMRAT
jgi:acyl-CoA synthetase (AMP-forming)/AMP-acid ligase II